MGDFTEGVGGPVGDRALMTGTAGVRAPLKIAGIVNFPVLAETAFVVAGVDFFPIIESALCLLFRFT